MKPSTPRACVHVSLLGAARLVGTTRTSSTDTTLTQRAPTPNEIATLSEFVARGRLLQREHTLPPPETCCRLEQGKRWSLGGGARLPVHQELVAPEVVRLQRPDPPRKFAVKQRLLRLPGLPVGAARRCARALRTMQAHRVCTNERGAAPRVDTTMVTIIIIIITTIVARQDPAGREGAKTVAGF